MSLVEKMRGDRKGWHKVSDLRPGVEIAVPRASGGSQTSSDVMWDEIVSITPVGREQVYDIEVEGTHNFVGNGIFAHNTYVLRANTTFAVEGQIYAGGVIVPVGSAAGATSTSALGSQIPPSVLTADGKGIDLYKLATYSLAGVQALAERVGAVETRLTSLEERLAALESGTISTASGSPSFASSTAQLVGWLADASNGIGDLFAKTFYASEKICVDDQCLTKDDVRSLLALVHPQTTSAPVGTTAVVTTTSATDSGLPTGQAGTTASTTITTDSASSPQATIALTTAASADATPPVVTLIGAAAMEITVGDAFTDPGATATDAVDGDVTANITVTGAVNTAVAGLYELTYSATDVAGNTGSVSRVVTVIAPPPDTTPPPAAAPAAALPADSRTVTP